MGGFECADNPTLTYTEVACPVELIEISKMDRGEVSSSPAPRPNLRRPTPSPQPLPTPDCGQPSGNCGCNWASESTCSTDDSSVCNRECCCRFRQPSTPRVPTPAAPPGSDPSPSP